MTFSDGFLPASLSRIFLPPRPSSCSLSHAFSESCRPITATRRKVAWVTLEGRLVGAEEATSVKTVGKGLGAMEAAAWELFTPLHRVLLVAIVAVASSDIMRSRRIAQLQHSLDVRDAVLRNMQEKLDDLCKQISLIRDQSSTSDCDSLWHNEHTINRKMAKASGAKVCHCGIRALHLNPTSGIAPLCGSQTIKTKDVYMTEPSKERLFENNQETASEQEERRMSDMSDFCWSVASSTDIQPVHLSTLAAEQELYNLRNECEEKDSAIKNLRAAVDASTVVYSKKIEELEEVIRRKNMINAKLKKDVVVLEQQMKKFTRLRKQSSFSSSSSPSSTSQVTSRPPVMAENILYDMSSTSPSSSSDCGSPERNRPNPSSTSADHILRQNSQRRRLQASSITPLKENVVNRKVEANSSGRRRQVEAKGTGKARQVVSYGMMDNKRGRRRNLQEEKNMMMVVSSSQKKWV